MSAILRTKIKRSRAHGYEHFLQTNVGLGSVFAFLCLLTGTGPHRKPQSTQARQSMQDS